LISGACGTCSSRPGGRPEFNAHEGRSYFTPALMGAGDNSHLPSLLESPVDSAE